MVNEKEMGASVASRLKHRFVYALIFLGGRWLAYLFLYPLVLFYTLMPSIRAKARPYVSRRFGVSRGPAFFKHVYLLNLTFAKTLADRAALGILGRVEIHSSDADRALCRDLLSRGNGLVLVTAHCGCWQMAAANVDFIAAPKYVLYYKNPKDNDKMVHEHAGKKAPFTLINPAGPLGGVVEMMAALRGGSALCAMGDRVFGKPDNSVSVPFLGAPVRLPYSFYRIAAAQRAPVMMLFFPWLGGGKFGAEIAAVLDVPECGPDKENYRFCAERFAGALEEFCRKYPYQFFNYFDLWENTHGENH